METTDVLICGAGPTGAMLAAQLHHLSIPTIILDKDAGITTDPRGIALDEDGIRALQSIGIYDKIFSDIGHCSDTFKFISGVHSDLAHSPMLQIDHSTTEGGTGHPGFICHKQPHLEKWIRSVFLGRESCVQLRQCCTLTGINEDEEWVYATYRASHGEEKVVRSKFFVGADGKTGFTRKKYLEPKGVVMERSSLTPYEETWVAVNWHISLPTPTSHPDFPLWNLGYSPEKVYDVFFPPGFRFMCNPQRPAVCGRFGTPKEMLWRFEYVVQPGEDGAEMATPRKLEAILHPYITHPGARYGLESPVMYPKDCITTLRARPFLFSARSCNKWALGRVVLAGDAAHVFPPFGGQGLASGFRDACALSWRLALACPPKDPSTTHNPIPHGPLLHSYTLERPQQLLSSLSATVANGALLTQSSALKSWLRDTWLWAIQMVPAWKRELEMGSRREGLWRYRWVRGVAFLPPGEGERVGGGGVWAQGFCAPVGRTSGVGDGREKEEEEVKVKGQGVDVVFTDDEIFRPGKRGLFQVVALADNADEVPQIYAELSHLAQPPTSHPYTSLAETTVIVMDPTATLPPGTAQAFQTIRMATADEFAKSPLCRDRPLPRYYDEMRIGKEVPGKRYVVVRPDRFVFAACEGVAELGGALGRIEGVLRGVDGGDSV